MYHVKQELWGSVEKPNSKTTCTSLESLSISYGGTVHPQFESHYCDLPQGEDDKSITYVTCRKVKHV